MSGIHARRRPRRAFDTIDSALQRSGASRALQTATVATAPPRPVESSLPVVSKPFDGRRRPVEELPAEPLGPRPTSSPDPERDMPRDEATEAVYRGIQAALDQYTAPFGRTV